MCVCVCLCVMTFDWFVNGRYRAPNPKKEAKMEESVDMDTDIPSEDHDNRPIEIKEEEEATQESPPTKSKWKKSS